MPSSCSRPRIAAPFANRTLGYRLPAKNRAEEEQVMEKFQRKW